MPISLSSQRILALSSISGFGLKRFYLLWDHFGSVDAIWQASYVDLVNAGLSPELSRKVDSLRKQSTLVLRSGLEGWLANDDCFAVSVEDEGYPSLLGEIYCPPPVLFMQGSMNALEQLCVSVVGSRNATIAGQRHAREFSAYMADRNITVVSGLALGVDASAHLGALDASGKTIAVLATGLDLIYPKKHAYLAERILDTGGLLISEMQLGTLPIPANFPRRNRIVSGLSHGVLVVEASQKSGSLITANYALEQNRDVFAIPGAIDNPLSKGCHSLIKQGASLVEEPEDILDALAGVENGNAKPLDAVLPDDLSVQARSILDLLSFDCTSFDDLILHSGLAVESTMQSLVDLELLGLVSSVPGGYQRLK